MLLGRLSELIAHPASRVNSESKHGKVDHSQPPWNAAVAHLILDLHAESRTMEADLRWLLDMPFMLRGGKDNNTYLALNAVLNLAEAAEDIDVAQCVKWLNSWCSRAAITLGDKEFPQHLPRDVGQSEPRCPYCEHLTLRFWSIRGEVRCINPECLDESQRRPVARMEYSIIAQEWVLAWKDGSVGVRVPNTAHQRTAS